MYCSACRLWFAEDDASVCPVCGGLLQLEVDNEKVVNDNVGASDHSSVRQDPSEDGDEAIRFLDDLWEKEDIDADLEGVFADIFDLDDDEVGELGVDVETVDEPKSGKPEDLCVPPLAVMPNRNNSLLLLVLVLMVIVVGSGSWLYMRNLGLKPVESVGRQASQPRQVHPATLPAAKTPVVPQRNTTAKPVVAISTPAEKPLEKSVAVEVKLSPALSYVVQIGSFKTKAGLDRQLAKLRKKGFAAHPVRVDLGKKGIWQRVYVSGGTSREKAKVMQEKLHKFFPLEKSWIVKTRTKSNPD